MGNLFKKPSGMMLLSTVLIFAAYSFVLSAPFKTMDDQVSIVNNASIKSFGHIGKIFRTAFFGDRSYYRPLVSLSYMIEYHFFDLQPLFYYLSNIILHSLNAVLVYFLVIQIFKNRLIAYYGMILFAVHPLHWEAVSNISGRSILLCALFYWTSFLSFLLFKDKRKPILWVMSLIFFTLSLLCKESAVMLPVVLFLYIWLCDPEPLEKRQNLFIAVIPFLGLITAYLLVRHGLGITEVFPWPTFVSLMLGFLTFLRGVITYFRLFILPLDLHFDRAQRVFTDFGDPQLIFTLMFYGVLVFVVYFLYRKGKLEPLILFLLLWFAAELFPVAQIISAVGVQPGFISIAEHCLYTPSVPVFILMILAARKIFEDLMARKMISKAVCSFMAGGLFIFLFLMTVESNIYASSERAMLTRSVAMNPRNTRLLYSLGLLSAQEGRFNEAESHFRKILATEPQNQKARIALGKALCDQGRCLEGVNEYEKITEAGNLKELLTQNLKLTYGILIEEQNNLIRQQPGNARLHYLLGIYYAKNDKPQEAAESFKKAVELEPSFKNGLFNLASTYEAMGRFEEAAVYWGKIVELNTEKNELDAEAFTRLGQYYQKTGDLVQAQKNFEQSKALRRSLQQTR